MIGYSGHRGQINKDKKSVDKSCMNLFSNESNMPHGLLSGDKKRKENNLYSVVTVVDKEFSTYSQIFLHTNIPLHSQIFRQISDLY